MRIGNIDITWLGHDGFLIKGKSVVMYVDPWVLSGTTPEADLILITHDHHDHCDPEKVKQLQKSDTLIVTTTPSARKLSGNVRTVAPGDRFEVKGVDIQVIHAYNIGKPYHPKGSGVGFVFKVDGTTIYHTGDSDLIPEMSNLGNIDIAFLPISGVYVMDELEATEAAATIKPRIVIPMHYGTLKEAPGDPQKFKRLMDSKDLGIEVRILG